MKKMKSELDEVESPSLVDGLLAQSILVEDEPMEQAHVDDGQLREEPRVHFAITEALARRHEHRWSSHQQGSANADRVSTIVSPARKSQVVQP
jgi:hypothetical protein